MVISEISKIFAVLAAAYTRFEVDDVTSIFILFLFAAGILL